MIESIDWVVFPTDAQTVDYISLWVHVSSQKLLYSGQEGDGLQHNPTKKILVIPLLYISILGWNLMLILLDLYTCEVICIMQKSLLLHFCLPYSFGISCIPLMILFFFVLPDSSSYFIYFYGDTGNLGLHSLTDSHFPSPHKCTKEGWHWIADEWIKEFCCQIWR